MGFSLKSWASHALKVPKEWRKINVGKSVRKAFTGAVENFEAGIKGAGSTVGETVGNVNQGAKAAQMLPWIIGGIGVVVLFMYMRRR